VIAIVAALRRLGGRIADRRRSPAGSAAGRGRGRLGERRARRAVRRAGVRIVARNLRIGPDEVDLLGVLPGRRTLVMIEVKTRGLRGKDAVGFSVGPAKRRRMARAAARLRSLPRYRGWAVRYDVVEVLVANDPAGRSPGRDGPAGAGARRGRGRCVGLRGPAVIVRHLPDAFRPDETARPG